MISEAPGAIASYFSSDNIFGEEITLEAGGYTTSSIDITKPGYSPIAVAGFGVIGSGSQYGAVSTCRLRSATEAQLIVRNTGNTSYTWSQFVRILYIKN